MKLKNLMPGILLLIGLAACIEDRIVLDDLSDDVLLKFEIPIPIVKATLVFEDFAGDDADSIIQDTIKLFLVEDLSFQDTVSLGDLGEKVDFEYLRLYHKETNMFPVGLDVRLYLYDSVSSENIDTIWFSDTPGEIFLQPAAVDSDELVIEDQVEETNGVIELDENVFNNLFDRTTHLILDAEVPSTPGYVRILDHYHLLLDLGLEAKGSFLITSDEE